MGTSWWKAFWCRITQPVFSCSSKSFLDSWTSYSDYRASEHQNLQFRSLNVEQMKIKSLVSMLVSTHLAYMFQSVRFITVDLNSCIFSDSYLPSSNIQTNPRTPFYFAHHWAIRSQKHNPFCIKSVRSGRETASQWKIVFKVTPAAKG